MAYGPVDDIVERLHMFDEADDAETEVELAWVKAEIARRAGGDVRLARQLQRKVAIRACIRLAGSMAAREAGDLEEDDADLEPRLGPLVLGKLARQLVRGAVEGWAVELGGPNYSRDDLREATELFMAQVNRELGIEDDSLH